MPSELSLNSAALEGQLINNCRRFTEQVCANVGRHPPPYANVRASSLMPLACAPYEMIKRGQTRLTKPSAF